MGRPRRGHSEEGENQRVWEGEDLVRRDSNDPPDGGEPQRV